MMRTGMAALDICRRLRPCACQRLFTDTLSAFHMDISNHSTDLISQQGWTEWLVFLPSSPSVRTLHVLTVSLWVLRLPPTRTGVRETDESKLPLANKCESKNLLVSVSNNCPGCNLPVSFFNSTNIKTHLSQGASVVHLVEPGRWETR